MDKMSKIKIKLSNNSNSNNRARILARDYPSRSGRRDMFCIWKSLQSRIRLSHQAMHSMFWRFGLWRSWIFICYNLASTTSAGDWLGRFVASWSLLDSFCYIEHLDQVNTKSSHAQFLESFIILDVV